jgi:hypothetical protein
MYERGVSRFAQAFSIRGNRRNIGSIWSHPCALSVKTTMPGSNRLGLSRLPAVRKIKPAKPPEPPLRLLLGRVALEMVQAKLKTFTAELDRFQGLTRGADFAAEEG